MDISNSLCIKLTHFPTQPAPPFQFPVFVNDTNLLLRAHVENIQDGTSLLSKTSHLLVLRIPLSQRPALFVTPSIDSLHQIACDST